jgi:hypothetical protein
MQFLILNNYKQVKKEVKAVTSGTHFKRMCRDKLVFVITILFLWIGSDTYVVSLCTLYRTHDLYFTSLKMTTFMVETSRSLYIQNNLNILVVYLLSFFTPTYALSHTTIY